VTGLTDGRAAIFAAVRAAGGPGLFNDPARIAALDSLLDTFGIERHGSGRHEISPAGIALIQRFESCARPLGDGRFAAYPDPGGKDGRPWTIGWGSTGPDIDASTVWTQLECNARFTRDLQRYVAEVVAALDGAPASQGQFDALVSFHYNTGAIRRATLTRRHKSGDYVGAAREFGKWIYSDGRRLAGLVRRRAAEASLYLAAP